MQFSKTIFGNLIIGDRKVKTKNKKYGGRKMTSVSTIHKLIIG